MEGVTIEEAIELLEDGMEVTLECDGYDYEIAPADGFIGGDGMEGFISVALGNIVHDEAEHVLNKSIKFLKESGKEVTIRA